MKLITHDLTLIFFFFCADKRQFTNLNESSNKEKSSGNGGLTKFLITGTSGIGKSCFLIYVLIQLLCENATVIFQSSKYEYFYYFENLTMISGSFKDFLPINKSTWYLADGIIS